MASPVTEAAQRIFADLADPQAVNRDAAGAWKAPLWRALEEAGLTLAWVPEALGGAGAPLSAGFEVLAAAGRYALAAPLAETLLAGWLLARGRRAPARGRPPRGRGRRPARGVEEPRPRPAGGADRARPGRHAARPRPRRAVRARG